MKTKDAMPPQAKAPSDKEWNPEFDATGAEQVSTRARNQLSKQQQEFAEHIRKNHLEGH